MHNRHAGRGRRHHRARGVSRLTLGLATGLLTLQAACFSFGDQSLADLDPDAAPVHPVYAQDVAPILDAFCTGCHSDAAMITARAGPYFDGEDLANSWACRIRQTTVIDRTMPPGAMERPTATELLTVDRWATDVLGGAFNCVFYGR